MSEGAQAQPDRAQIDTEGWHPGHNPWLIALTVTMATFMEVLDTSIANVSLPHMAGSLSVTQDQSTWVLTSYLVSNAIVLPLSGWLANRFGRKRFYVRGALYRQLFSVRHRAEPGSLDLLSRPAGHRRRRARTQRAIDSG
jgi:cytochrome bd-type quinol oxidase subunit 1